MKYTDNTFNQVFEQYVFTVASACIELGEPATQTQLIQLLTRVNQAVDRTTPVKGNLSSEPAEWDQVLATPVNWHSVDEQWLLNVREAQRARQQQYIDWLEVAIQTTHQRLQALQTSVLGEPHRSRITDYCQQRLQSYQQQLAQASEVLYK